MIKQIRTSIISLVSFGVIAFGLGGAILLPVGHAQAQVPRDPVVVAAKAPATCNKPKFFGLIPWYQYLTLDANCDITNFQFLPGTKTVNGVNKPINSDIPVVLLAVVDDLLRIAGLIAVGYVIYGGIQYTISQGNPDGTARAQATVLNALIGLVIALTAVVGVNFIGTALGG